MKILYVVHQFYPQSYTGTEKFILNLAKMAQCVGHKVKVVTYSFYDKLHYSKQLGNILSKEYVYQGIPVVEFSYEHPPADLHFGMHSEEFVPFAERILEGEKPDLVHVGHPMRMTEFLRMAKKKFIPYIITLTDFWFICPKYILLTSKNTLYEGPSGGDACEDDCPEFSKRIIQSRLQDAMDLLQGACGVFSPSQFLADIFNKVQTEFSVEVINHGMNYSHIVKNKKNYTKNSKLTFFFGGSFNIFKGLHIVLEAFGKIKSDKLSIRVYGQAVHEEYNERLKSLALNDDRIEFCGLFTEDQIGDILSNIDIAIVPSLWYENYPLILHEALACDVPVVASDIGGMAEKIKDGYNGYTFKAGDVESLRETIETVLKNPEQLNELKKNIRNNMLPTVEQEAYIYNKIYNYPFTE